MLPLVIGHRGVKEFAPENSISSIYMANNLKIRSIEIDVQLSKDNRPIVFHDETLDRCTGFPGYVKDFTYNELLKYNISSSYIFTKEKIPSLKQFVKLCDRFNIFLNVEIKECDNKMTPNIVCNEIKKIGSPNNIVISSFNVQYLETAMYIIPEYDRMYIVEKIPDNFLNILNKYKCKGLVISLQHNSLHEIIDLSIFPINLYVYTVNDKDVYNTLIKHGIGVITDYPYSFQKYR